MPTEAQPAPLANAMHWAGVIVSGLAILFLAFDGVTKMIRVAPVVTASEKLGIPPHAILGVGVVLVACTALYAIPQTAVLGAVLLTGYLGGAAAIHLRAGSGLFPIAFSVAFGVLVWAGLVLREPRLFWTILLRQ